MLEKYALIKVMKKFFAEPERGHGIREFAREAKISPGTAEKCLKYLAKKGLAKTSAAGRARVYSPAIENPLTRQWKLTLWLEEINNAGIVEDIKKEDQSISSILLYGSVARGEDDLKSDIDLLVISVSKKKIDTDRIRNRLKRETNVLVYTPQEWRKKAREDKVFYDRVILDCVVLYGEKPVAL